MTKEQFTSHIAQIDQILMDFKGDNFQAQVYSREAELIVQRLNIAKTFLQNCIDKIENVSPIDLPYHEVVKLVEEQKNIIQIKDEEIKNKDSELDQFKSPKIPKGIKA